MSSRRVGFCLSGSQPKLSSEAIDVFLLIGSAQTAELGFAVRRGEISRIRRGLSGARRARNGKYQGAEGGVRLGPFSRNHEAKVRVKQKKCLICSLCPGKKNEEFNIYVNF
uniref:Uncharacterized protein n=1 Tax=Oryza meridionalis TaxID=40149 RepID=A0A0E0CBD3_9ORYZ